MQVFGAHPSALSIFQTLASVRLEQLRSLSCADKPILSDPTVLTPHEGNAPPPDGPAPGGPSPGGAARAPASSKGAAVGSLQSAGLRESGGGLRRYTSIDQAQTTPPTSPYPPTPPHHLPPTSPTPPNPP